MDNWPVFDWLLRSSAMASVFVLFLLVFKFVIKDRLGAKWHYYIWFLVVLRLLLPFAPQSPVSIYNLTSNTQPTEHSFNLPDRDVTPVVEEIPQDILMPEGAVAPPEIQAPTAASEPQNVDTVIQPANEVNVIYIIWLFGILTLLLYTLLTNVRFWLSIKDKDSTNDEVLLNLINDCKQMMGIRVKVPIIETKQVKSITLYGFIRPRLLLPDNLRNEISLDDLRYIILHELAHVKQKDVIVNWLVALLQIVHWFNPLLWYGFYRMRQDREIACDALAMSYLHPEEYKNYGTVIINLLEKFSRSTRLPGMVGIADDRSSLKKRMTMIAVFKKNKYRLSMLAVILVVIFSAIFLTDAFEGDIVPEIPQLEPGQLLVDAPKDVQIAILADPVEFSNHEWPEHVAFDEEHVGAFLLGQELPVPFENVALESGIIQIFIEGENLWKRKIGISRLLPFNDTYLSTLIVNQQGDVLERLDSWQERSEEGYTVNREQRIDPESGQIIRERKTFHLNDGNRTEYYNANGEMVEATELIRDVGKSIEQKYDHNNEIVETVINYDDGPTEYLDGAGQLIATLVTVKNEDNIRKMLERYDANGSLIERTELNEIGRRRKTERFNSLGEIYETYKYTYPEGQFAIDQTLGNHLRMTTEHFNQENELLRTVEYYTYRLITYDGDGNVIEVDNLNYLRPQF
ncbi:M56 family metallopeptidase [Dethiobacter alkaliphilus]|uniref:Peptidase M56 BlaR1 n=1 Tax=Dethiobacter alkaliphilus AHT 1 TaxID=555088 RepID=C0GHR1_DETAL|nr:M56 family metallopeptidase [Dethiobacter alkaliphilus]EEG77267.1 peptidase M56 BlaR1 [Dethiobacter alkaliphilus AHT 1]